jgi:hypothetical protein
VHSALEQARRYADEQKVKCIAVSDGVMFYAASIEGGGLRDRVFASLESKEPHSDLWWLSEHGVYRPRTGPQGEPLTLLKSASVTRAAITGEDQMLNCFIQNIVSPHSALLMSEMQIGPRRGNCLSCWKTEVLTQDVFQRRYKPF